MSDCGFWKVTEIVWEEGVSALLLTHTGTCSNTGRLPLQKSSCNIVKEKVQVKIKMSN